MAPKKVSVGLDELRRVAVRIFAARGMPEANAARVAEVLVWADAGGHGSHGVGRIPTYLKFIEAGDLDPAGVPLVDVDSGAVFRVDARRTAGAAALSLAVGMAEERARRHGVAFGVVGHTTHIGAAGYYAQRLAEAGLVGIVLSAGVPLMAYHGTKVASVATAPLSVAIPAGDRPPLLLDMASSVVALGKIRQALANGTPLQPGWALTADGRPTTDPAEAGIQLPLGGAKGAGLALMFEAIASLLGSAPVLVEALGGAGRRRHVQNAALIAVDVAKFREPAGFAADVAALVDTLKRLPKAEGVEEILMPGERSQALRARAAARGVEIRADLWDELQALARA
ncbi:Ldh family oxidoreductase [Propylenella binzhouense]|nr:Ldh family oxidoreductase [Propylenella binzhouense]